MALTIGNITNNITNPSGGDVTFSHTQNTGSDGYLYVYLNMGNAEQIPQGVTYGGVAMTLVNASSGDSSFNVKNYLYQLANPSTGSNNIVVDFPSFGQYGNVYTKVISTTGSAGIGNYKWSNVTTTTATLNLVSVGTGSTVFATMYNNTSLTQTITINGTAYTAPFENKFTRYSVDVSTQYKQNVTNGNASGSVSTVYVVAGYAFEITASASAVVPTVTTTAISNIGRLTASSGGNVTADGGASVTARGVCWNTSTDPTTSNSKTTDGTGTGTFTSSITSLSPNTLYYVRAYATNSVGTSYGSNISFRTKRRIIIT